MKTKEGRQLPEKARDEEKFEQFYEKHRKIMFLAAYKVTNDYQLAEDAVSEAMLSVSKRLDSLKSANPLSEASYAVIAARNKALDIMKKGYIESTVPLEDFDAVSDEMMLERLCEKEEFDAVVRSIRKLDSKYRDVLTLYYFNECKIREIAQLLGRNENTVKQQLARGRHKLIEIIRKETKDYDESK